MCIDQPATIAQPNSHVCCNSWSQAWASCSTSWPLWESHAVCTAYIPADCLANLHSEGLLLVFGYISDVCTFFSFFLFYVCLYLFVVPHHSLWQNCNFLTHPCLVCFLFYITVCDKTATCWPIPAWCASYHLLEFFVCLHFFWLLFRDITSDGEWALKTKFPHPSGFTQIFCDKIPEVFWDFPWLCQDKMSFSRTLVHKKLLLHKEGSFRLRRLNWTFLKSVTLWTFYQCWHTLIPVSYTHLRAHETG